MQVRANAVVDFGRGNQPSNTLSLLTFFSPMDVSITNVEKLDPEPLVRAGTQFRVTLTSSSVLFGNSSVVDRFAIVTTGQVIDNVGFGAFKRLVTIEAFDEGDVTFGAEAGFFFVPGPGNESAPIPPVTLGSGTSLPLIAEMIAPRIVGGVTFTTSILRSVSR